MPTKEEQRSSDQEEESTLSQDQDENLDSAPKPGEMCNLMLQRVMERQEQLKDRPSILGTTRAPKKGNTPTEPPDNLRLTPSEIESLRQRKKQISAQLNGRFKDLYEDEGED